MAKSKMLKVKDPTTGRVYILVYIRVSTDRQAEEGYSIEIQKERLAAYVKSMFGDDVSVEYFIDDGYSGGSLERPEMQRLIETIKAGLGTHVIVYKLDRLSRSQKDTLYLIEDIFLMHNVAFVSIQESFNTATAFGRAVVGILSVFAQLERENIFERTRSGMQKRVASGLWPGGGRVPFGYDYDPQQGILVPNKDADTVRAVYALYLDGYSPQHIANKLGLKYDRLAYQILIRKSNAGYIVYNGEEYKGQHEPIVSLETYEKAMAMMRSRKKNYYSSSSSSHLLTGLVYCGKCGAKMRYIKWGKQGYKLVCYSRMKSKPYLVKDPDCPSLNYDAATVEAKVMEYVFQAAANFINNTAEPRTPEKAPPAISSVLQDRYDGIAHKLKRLYRLYAESPDEILRGSINEMQVELETLANRIKMETERDTLDQDYQLAMGNFEQISSAWDYATDIEKKSLLASVIDTITLKDEEIIVDFKI